MLTEERQSEILRLLGQKNAVTVLELTNLLGASESTIRRDLNDLHRQRLLNKVHGGATAAESTIYRSTEDAVSVRREQQYEEKKAIGRYAASLIRPDDFVYMDAGTSTEHMIDFITEKDAIFVTNAVSHAQKLVQKGLTVYILGGRFKQATEAIVGPQALDDLSKYNFTKGFFGTNGVHQKSGYTTPDPAEANVKRMALTRCKEKYILADPTKFNQVSPITFCELAGAVVLTTPLRDTMWKHSKNIREVTRL